jgi:predicted nucleotidyltransferase
MSTGWSISTETVKWLLSRAGFIIDDFDPPQNAKFKDLTPINMTPDERIKTEIRKICDRMEGELRGYRVVLFGSRASGGGRSRSRARSDFDIGILGEAPLPLKTFYAMEDLFEEIPTLYRIDWVDLNRVSPAFRREALKQTEVLHG